MAGVPIAAASGPNAIIGSLRFTPVQDEDMLPEARKDIADQMWETIQQCNIDCIFNNKLPAQEEFTYAETSLETVPVLVQHTPAGGAPIYTQRDIDRSVNEHRAVVLSNTKKSEMKAQTLQDYKCQLGVALLRAFKQHAPLFEVKMRKDHILVAATADVPAKHDGCAIFRAFRDATNHNDASRQAANAQAHLKRLEIKMPNNCTSSQFAHLTNTFITEIVPYLNPALDGKLQVEWIMARMPDELIDRRDAIRAKLRADSKLDDVDEAIKQCRSACDDRHDFDLGAPDVTAVFTRHVALLELSKQVFLCGGEMPVVGGQPIGASADAGGRGTGRGGRGDRGGRGGGRGGKGGQQPRERRKLNKLPGGQMCSPDGSCNLDHMWKCHAMVA